MSEWIPTLVTSAAPREVVDEITAIATGFHPAGMRAALRTAAFNLAVREFLHRLRS